MVKTNHPQKLNPVKIFRYTQYGNMKVIVYSLIKIYRAVLHASIELSKYTMPYYMQVLSYLPQRNLVATL